MTAHNAQRTGAAVTGWVSACTAAGDGAAAGNVLTAVGCGEHPTQYSCTSSIQQPAHFQSWLTHKLLLYNTGDSHSVQPLATCHQHNKANQRQAASVGPSTQQGISTRKLLARYSNQKATSVGPSTEQGILSRKLSARYSNQTVASVGPQHRIRHIKAQALCKGLKSKSGIGCP